GARVTVRLTALEATRLPWPVTDAVRLGDYWTSHLHLGVGDTNCPPATPARPLATAPGELAFEWRVNCPAPGSRHIASDAFLDVAPSHPPFARLRGPDGRTAAPVLSNPTRRVSLDAPAAPAVSQALRLGVAHILSGWDHLAFILAL